MGHSQYAMHCHNKGRELTTRDNESKPINGRMHNSDIITFWFSPKYSQQKPFTSPARAKYEGVYSMLKIGSILYASQCIIISKILSRSTTLSFICAEFQNFSIYFEYIIMPVFFTKHYSDVITSVMVCQITSASIVYSTICSGRSKKTSKLCITGLCEEYSPVNSPHTRASNAKNVSFDDVITDIFSVL